MNVEDVIKTTKVLPVGTRTLIHIQLVNNKINDRLTEALKPFGVSLQQFNVLRILKGQKGQPANLSTLNDRMVNKMSNTTRLVDKLLTKGYAHRERCSTNRRKIEICITEEGRLALEQMNQAINEAEKLLIQDFKEKDFNELNTLLNKF